MFFQTLYMTNASEEIETAEYYRPQLDIQLIDGVWRYFVREEHGWFDDVTKKHVHFVSSLNLNREKGFASYEQASQRYDEQVRHRAAQGFVHSFMDDPTSPDGVWYHRIWQD